MTLKEVASGNQYLRALLAGKSDGYCGELNAKAQRCRQSPPCPADGEASPRWVGSRGQPCPGGWQWCCCPAGLCHTLSQPKEDAGVYGATEQGRTGLVLPTAVSPLSPSNDGVHIYLSAVGDAGYPPLGFTHNTANQRGLAPAAWPWDWGSWGRLVRDGGSRGGSRHPSGIRVVLRNGQRAAWGRNTARVHDGQTEKLWDKVHSGNLAKIMEIWGHIGEDVCDRGCMSDFPLFPLKTTQEGRKGKWEWQAKSLRATGNQGLAAS